MMGIKAVLVFSILVVLLAAHCSDNSDSNEVEVDTDDEVAASAKCKRYCQLERECSAEWFGLFYGGLKKCTNDCDRIRASSEILGCLFDCNEIKFCEEWVPCDRQCYETRTGVSSAYDICGDYDSDKVLSGGFQVASSQDIETLNVYACMTGDLEMKESDLTEISLPNLEAVGGSVTIQSTPFKSVVLNNLKIIGGSLHILNNEFLIGLGLNNLAKVHEYMNVFGNEAIVDPDLGKLEIVGWAFSIYDNYNLFKLKMDRLKNVDGRLEIYANPFLDHIDMKRLERVSESLLIYENSTLPSCVATEIGAQLKMTSGLCIHDNAEDECSDDNSGC